MFKKRHHGSHHTLRTKHPEGQTKIWGRKSSNLTDELKLMCANHGVADMAELSRKRARDETGKRHWKSNEHPILTITTGSAQTQLDPKFQTHDHTTPFPEVHACALQQFPTAHPVHVVKWGNPALTRFHSKWEPGHGTIISTESDSTKYQCASLTMDIVESLVLGAAAGTLALNSGQKFVGYQMQRPVYQEQMVQLSETLEIECKGAYDPGPWNKEFDLVTTMTYVKNKEDAQVPPRYRNFPCLLIDVAIDRKGLTRAIPEAEILRSTNYKLMNYQLACPARKLYGMHINPADFLTGLMRKVEVVLNRSMLFSDFGDKVAENRGLTHWVETFLGQRRRDCYTDEITEDPKHPLGIPVEWILNAIPRIVELGLDEATATRETTAHPPEDDIGPAHAVLEPAPEDDRKMPTAEKPQAAHPSTTLEQEHEEEEQVTEEDRKTPAADKPLSVHQPTEHVPDEDRQHPAVAAAKSAERALKETTAVARKKSVGIKGIRKPLAKKIPSVLPTKRKSPPTAVAEPETDAAEEDSPIEIDDRGTTADYPTPIEDSDSDSDGNQNSASGNNQESS